MKYIKQILMLVAIIVGIIIIGQRISVFPLQDFIAYWTAGRLNLTGHNPYDVNQMMNLQQTLGWSDERVLMMWYPPWTLPFVMLLGLFPYSLSRLIWFICEVIIFCVTASFYWKIFHGQDKKEWIAWIFVLAFGPSLQLLKLGQIVPLMILGITGFIYFNHKGNFFWAGVLTSFVLIKPHSIYLFIIAVTMWAIFYRKWKYLAGFVITPIILSGIAMVTNTKILMEYLDVLLHYPPDFYATATLGTPLRLIFGSDNFYLQFLAPILGILWFIFHWFRNWKIWHWEEQLPLIILVSASTAAFGWVTDLSIAMIAIIQIAAWLNYKVWTLQTALLFVAFWIVSLLCAFLSVNQHWFWWLGSYYLIWYIIARKIIQPPKEYLTTFSNYETV
jgi:hypothetical protein